MIIREYLKLARSFNAVLTGISPVMGAIAMQDYNLFHLFLLFLVGFLGHTYGFVLNDIVDFRIDKNCEEISDRPLISGTISLRKAWVFAAVSMVAAFVVAFYIAFSTQRFFPLIVLVVSAFFITVYDLISKKLPGMDVFVALGIFFLILYGAVTVVGDLTEVTLLAWIVCLLGSIQVLFMQFIAGGMKDIENDFKSGAKTLAVKMGVRVVNGVLRVSFGFKTLAYTLQIIDIILVFMPFLFIPGFTIVTVLRYLQWMLLILIAGLMMFFSHKLLGLERFDRDVVRKYIGLHYYTNFALVPVMLMTLNPWIIVLMVFPALGFILSNLILHGTILQPKTM